MSILLDALKKSETQRQLGKTPSIHTPVEAPDAERKTEQPWIVLSMLALSVLAISWVGWQQFRQAEETSDKAGVDVLSIPEVEESPVLAEEPEQHGTDRAPAASMWNLKKGVAGLTILPADNLQEARQRRERLNRSFSSYQPEKDPASAPEAESSPANVTRTSPDSATTQPPGEEALAATPDGHSSRLEPHQPEPISFWQIPQALRDGLPEFRINVLVYAQNPQDRFVLINGQRLVEKEEFIDGVILDEIRRDGAVFRYRNYRFLVKG